MKIFLVSNMYPSLGDPLFGVFVKNIKEGLEKINVDFSSISCIEGKSGNIFQKTGKYLRYFGSIISNYSKGNYDLIYIHYLSINSILFRLIFLLYPIKSIVVNVHGSDVMKEHFVMRFFNTYLLRKAQLIVVPSEYFKEEMLLRYRFLESKDIFVSPSGGVNTDVFYEKHNKQNNELILGFVSRIDNGKGWDLFLMLINDLKKMNLAVKGIIVGDGLERVKLLALINTLQIQDVVDYRGLLSQDKLIDMFNQMDLFIFPTLLCESLGLVGLESITCGTPVIASNIGGPSGYIIDGVNGYKFKPGSSKELTSKVLQFIELDEAGKEKIRIQAIKTSIEYSHQIVIKKLHQKLLELC